MKKNGKMTYDHNGNLTHDLNKGITEIKYNMLNLPSKITYSDGSTAVYTYSATGEKLGVRHVTANSNVYEAYCDNFIYRAGSLKRVLVDGGYITLSGGTKYHYYLKDHLGNNRMVVRADGTVEQVTHYYPYGGLTGESTGGDTQPYKYNGKELERTGGLDLYDYGARWMDSKIGARFTTMDPMCEKYYGISPYAYCANNPVRFVDPDGRLCGDYYRIDGTYVGSDGIKDDKAYVLNSRGDVSFMNQKYSLLSVSNSTLNQFANTIAQESSGNKLESYALASAIINISKYKHKTVSETLKSEGIYGYKDGGYSTKYNNNKEYSMEAALNALTEGKDYSNGALRWDGFDLAAKGFNHVKARTAGILISSAHFNSFKSAWPNSMIKAYSGGKFTEFSKNFAAGNHPATQGLNKGLTLYQSSAVYGRTIFWAPIENKKFNGKY